MKTCEDCQGEGTQDQLNCSASSSSECCGGCYKEVTCRTCQGSGEVEYEEELYEELDVFIEQWDLTKEELIKILQE